LHRVRHQGHGRRRCDCPARGDLQRGQRCIAAAGRGTDRDAAHPAPAAHGDRPRQGGDPAADGKRMKAARFNYARPRDAGEALAALAKAEGGKIVGGGQSLGPMLNLRLARPALLVDISRLKALQQMEDTGRTWHIGAGVTHARLEDARGRLSGGEMLCEVAAAIAYRSVRNRGTVGGSLAHADPAADWPLPLAALAASLTIR